MINLTKTPSSKPSTLTFFNCLVNAEPSDSALTGVGDFVGISPSSATMSKFRTYPMPGIGAFADDYATTIQTNRAAATVSSHTPSTWDHVTTNLAISKM